MKKIEEIEKLKQFKKRSKWSYEKMSGHMGVHSQTLMNWMKGKYKPSLMARDKIRKFLDDFSFI